jgi:AbiV family abortive infection protein
MSDSFKLIDDAIKISSSELIGFKSSEEFDKALIHTENLIHSSIVLFKNGYKSQSLFLTITSIEEMAKIEVCIFRGRSQTKNVNRQKDILFNHPKKHIISANEIILIGKRLNKSIGTERAKQIFIDLQNGVYGKIRESCLYFSRNQTGLKLPDDAISMKFAAELLLVSIEMMDDKFWGMTNIATETCERLNGYYLEIEQQIEV